MSNPDTINLLNLVSLVSTVVVGAVVKSNIKRTEVDGNRETQLGVFTDDTYKDINDVWNTSKGEWFKSVDDIRESRSSYDAKAWSTNFFDNLKRLENADSSQLGEGGILQASVNVIRWFPKPGDISDNNMRPLLDIIKYLNSYIKSSTVASFRSVLRSISNTDKINSKLGVFSKVSDEMGVIKNERNKLEIGEGVEISVSGRKNIELGDEDTGLSKRSILFLEDLKKRDVSDIINLTAGFFAIVFDEILSGLGGKTVGFDEIYQKSRDYVKRFNELKKIEDRLLKILNDEDPDDEEKKEIEEYLDKIRIEIKELNDMYDGVKSRDEISLEEKLVEINEDKKLRDYLVKVLEVIDGLEDSKDNISEEADKLSSERDTKAREVENEEDKKKIVDEYNKKITKLNSDIKEISEEIDFLIRVYEKFKVPGVKKRFDKHKEKKLERKKIDEISSKISRDDDEDDGGMFDIRDLLILRRN